MLFSMAFDGCVPLFELSNLWVFLSSANICVRLVEMYQQGEPIKCSTLL